MIFQFNTQDLTFFDEDREYFEKRLKDVKKTLGSLAGDKDSVDVKIHLEKGKEKSGAKFTAKIHMTTPHGGDFYAETIADNIKKCADDLKGKLNNQVKKFHEKRTH